MEIFKYFTIILYCMDVEKKKAKVMFRVDVKDWDSRKVKGFNVYKDGKKISLKEFADKLKEKVKEI